MKGSYYNIKVKDKEIKDAVWYYRYPTTESASIAGRLCFYNEKVDVFVDGVRKFFRTFCTWISFLGRLLVNPTLQPFSHSLLIISNEDESSRELWHNVLMGSAFALSYAEHASRHATPALLYVTRGA
jgi:hypothetical protein